MIVRFSPPSSCATESKPQKKHLQASYSHPLSVPNHQHHLFEANNCSMGDSLANTTTTTTTTARQHHQDEASTASRQHQDLEGRREHQQDSAFVLATMSSGARKLSLILSRSLSAYVSSDPRTRAVAKLRTNLGRQTKSNELGKTTAATTRRTCTSQNADADAAAAAAVYDDDDDDDDKYTTQRTFDNERNNSKSSSNIEREDQDANIDSGYAWIILVVIFFINASTFGTARAYGLIFERVARQAELDSIPNGRAQAALPFTLMGAIENMAGPLSGYLLSRSQNPWRLMVSLGSCLIVLAHFISSFVDPIHCQWGQSLSMGLMCGLGLSFVTISFFQINNAYFIKYRSTAFGIGLTGAAVGTFYISPICQFCLDRLGINSCYLMLALILLPNVPLALLLKPKKHHTSLAVNTATVAVAVAVASAEPELLNSELQAQIESISKSVQLEQQAATTEEQPQSSIRTNIKRVLRNPMFHLIWPTQMLFCWFNFVFGMIIVDFGRDRGLNVNDLARLLPVWASGQLVGRLILGPLVDLKYFTYRSWTVICFACIAFDLMAMNTINLANNSSGSGSYNDNNNNYNNNNKATESDNGGGFSSAVESASLNALTLLGLVDNSQASGCADTDPLLSFIMLALIFILSMFIALLYLLFNGLIVRYVQKQLQPFCIGISSFVGSFFLLPRASVIGYYRDTVGNYDSMITLFAWISLGASFAWLICPNLGPKLKAVISGVATRVKVDENYDGDNDDDDDDDDDDDNHCGGREKPQLNYQYHQYHEQCQELRNGMPKYNDLVVEEENQEHTKRTKSMQAKPVDQHQNQSCGLDRSLSRKCCSKLIKLTVENLLKDSCTMLDKKIKRLPGVNGKRRHSSQSQMFI